MDNFQRREITAEINRKNKFNKYSDILFPTPYGDFIKFLRQGLDRERAAYKDCRRRHDIDRANIHQARLQTFQDVLCYLGFKRS